MSTQHTPGPWISEEWNIRNPDGLDIATVDTERSTDRSTDDPIPEKEWVANARLIAAAPEMLDALRLALTCLDAAADGRLEDVKDEIGGTANIVDEVIYKATK